MSQPLVSVIMPVYNASVYLKHTIGSILSQTFSDFEFVIINDASTDDSREIIKSFNDHRIVYLENEINKGYIFSLNRALKIVKGKYIARMDADDVSLPDRFLKQYEFLEKESSIDLVGAAIKIQRENRVSDRDEIWDYPTTPGGVKARLLFNTGHAHPVVFFRRTLIDQGLYEYDPSFYPAEDYELWVRLNRNVNTSNLPDVKLLYRVSEQQTSSLAHEKQKHNSSRIRALYFLSLVPQPGVISEELIYRFWQTQFCVTEDEALLLFKGYVSIYSNSEDSDFKEELANQINQLITRIYQIQPQFVKAFRGSVFEKHKKLSFKDEARIRLYPVWKRLKRIL